MENTKISLSLPVANRLLNDVSELLDVHFELIRLFQKESELKKHHRAYLHVREQMEDMIRASTPCLARIAEDLADAYSDVKAMCGMADAREMPCEGCTCYDCDRMCWECSREPDCPTGQCGDKEFPFIEVDEDSPSVFPVGDGDYVCMSRSDFDLMLEDVLTLAELVEMTTEMRCEDYALNDRYARYIPQFAAFEHNRLDIYKDAHFEAEAVMNRWEDAEFGEVRAVTVEMPQ